MVFQKCKVAVQVKEKYFQVRMYMLNLIVLYPQKYLAP